MTGHRVTPYEVTATRKRAPEDQRDDHLLLASIGKDATIDLADAVAAHVTDVAPLVRKQKGDIVAGETDADAWSLQCVQAKAINDGVSMVFAMDVAGEREVVHDGQDPARPVLYTKGNKDVTRFYSCALLWRPPAGESGILLLHSPWGRGGSRNQILTLLQRSVDAAGAKAKLHADPMIPAKALNRILDRSKATKIVYSKTKGITSSFDNSRGTTSTRAEMDLVVKGSETIPYRDALKAALRSNANRERFFTVRLRDDDSNSGYREETFDEVAVDLETAAGTKRYSMRDNTIPTVSFDKTPEINSIYYALPSKDDKGWTPDCWQVELLDGVTPLLERVVQDVQLDL